MLVHRAYKTQLKPNDRQVALFRQYCGAARYVYNWALADRIARYERGEKTNMYEQKQRFNSIKDDICPWIRDVAYQVTEYAFANLDAAYQNFFRRVKAGDKQAGFPKFKSRKRGIGSFTVRGAIRVDHKAIKLPRIGWVRLKERDYLPLDGVKVLSATVSERTGKWFVSLQVEEEIPDRVSTGEPIGVDLGVKSLAVCSNGKTFETPRELYRLEAKLRRLQRKLSRQLRGGMNYRKTKQAIARLWFRISEVRRYVLHQISTYLTARVKPRVIVLEDLNVRGMSSNHHLAKAVLNSAMAELRRQIEYKAAWCGIDVLIADRWYPSSKTCSRCGCINDDLVLADRTFVCPECGFTIDRDMNGAVNLRNLALKPRVTACEDGEVAAFGQCPVMQQEACSRYLA